MSRVSDETGAGTAPRAPAVISFADWMSGHAARIERALETALPAADEHPVPLHDAMRYAVLGGGKRIRPLLVLAAGCVGPSRFGDVEQGLDQELGQLTYEEAQDRWGEPLSLDKGETLFTAFWEKKRSSGLITERLYLTFDNAKQVLRAYRYSQKPLE